MLASRWAPAGEASNASPARSTKLNASALLISLSSVARWPSPTVAAAKSARHTHSHGLGRDRGACARSPETDRVPDERPIHLHDLQAFAPLPARPRGAD